MKIRLSGSEDLVRQWGGQLEKDYGISGSVYPNKKGSDVRWYADIDDRKAEKIIKEVLLKDSAKKKMIFTNE